jgi:hypothetical protein
VIGGYTILSVVKRLRLWMLETMVQGLPPSVVDFLRSVRARARSIWSGL